MAAFENPQMLIEILSRLSPEILLRLKSVCKSWYALINALIIDPYFVNQHFSNSVQRKYILRKHLVLKNSGKYEVRFSFLDFPLSLDLSVSTFDFPFGDFPCLGIRDHSHGLFCLSDLRRDIFLSNPATREFRKLPTSIILLPQPPQDRDIYESIDAVGFGYDAKSRDFKVVRVVEFVAGSAHLPIFRVELYDLSKDKWREIETPVCGDAAWAPSFEMYYEGMYYWWAYNEDECEMILSFNLSEEVFADISLPESIVQPTEKYRSMGTLNGSIVLFHYPCQGNEKTFNVWEMEKDERGVVSWSKLLTIGPIYGIDKPLMFVSSDELLMEANEGQVILYNIKTQQINELPIKGHPAKFQATFFIKSLLSVKGGNNIFIDEDQYAASACLSR